MRLVPELKRRGYRFVELAELPLTPNEKVDRRALPAPDYRGELKDRYVAPQSRVQELLAGIWAEVLKVSRVGIHDNFFELGGHSLLATQIVSRVLQTFKVELPLRALFEAPTIATLSDRIEANWAAGDAISRNLRQRCRDFVECSGEFLITTTFR